MRIETIIYEISEILTLDNASPYARSIGGNKSIRYLAALLLFEYKLWINHPENPNKHPKGKKRFAGDKVAKLYSLNPRQKKPISKLLRELNS